jgi:hypothetical protein
MALDDGTQRYLASQAHGRLAAACPAYRQRTALFQVADVMVAVRRSMSSSWL